MRRSLAIVMLLAAAPLAAQESLPRTLDGFAFLTGCWSGPFTSRSGTGTLEERWTSPSSNVMLGATRWLSDGRTSLFEFSVLRADSAGIVLVPHPDGVRSEDAFRLTRLSGDTAVFEAPDHDYPKRIIYRRTAATLTARTDGGPEDQNPREWTMAPADCVPGADLVAREGPPALPPSVAGLDQSGRVGFIVFETLGGLYMAVAVPAMFGADGATAIGLGLLIGPTAGLLLSKLYSDNYPVSTGQATTIVWGGWFGLWQALGWTLVATDDVSARGAWTAMVAGLTAGTAASIFVASRPISAGDASMVAWGASWGTWYGLALGVLANRQDDALLGWTLVGGLAGLAGSAYATGRTEWSNGRVWLVSAAGLAGLVAGFGIDLIAQTRDAESTLGVPMVTSAVGLILGSLATESMERRRAERAEGTGAGRGPGPREAALLAVRDGRLRLGVPAPAPALVPRDDGRTRRWVPGARVTLFEWTH